MIAKPLGKKSLTAGGRTIEMEYAGADISIPLLYPPRFGEIYVRLFLDAQGEIWRSIHVHGNASNPFALPCWDRSACPVCQHLLEFDKSWPGISKYRRSEAGFAYAWLYRYKGKMPHVLNCVNKSLILYGHTRFLNELSQAILQLLNKNPTLEFCNPQESFRPFQIKFLPEKKDYHVVVHQGHKEPAVEVPDNLPPLSKLIFEENEEPDPLRLDQYLAKMKNAHSQWLLKKP